MLYHQQKLKEGATGRGHYREVSQKMGVLQIGVTKYNSSANVIKIPENGR